jgi:DNA replication protein DnaC
MSEFVMERLRESLVALKMGNTLEILDNYLERAIKDNINLVEALTHIFCEEAKAKRKKAYEIQIRTSGFPIKKGLDDFYRSLE